MAECIVHVCTCTIHSTMSSSVNYHWDSLKCPYKRGVLISGVVLYINVIIGTPESVLIREVSLLERCPY